MKTITIGQHVVDWVAKRSTDYGAFGPAVGIGLESDGALVAGVCFNGYTKTNICMHVASDGSRRWMNREYLWYSFYYPFEQLGVKRITGMVGEGNAAARRFDEHIGFRLETRLKDACETGDLLVYVMWRDQCKWLGVRRNAKAA